VHATVHAAPVVSWSWDECRQACQGTASLDATHPPVPASMCSGASPGLAVSSIIVCALDVEAANLHFLVDCIIT
jgi:hypothetical protein